MSKPRLTLAEIEGMSAVELPERNLHAVAVGNGGLIGIGVVVNRSLNDVIDIQNNEVCVSVAAINSASGCAQ
jgi:hypothetical protein